MRVPIEGVERRRVLLTLAAVAVVPSGSLAYFLSQADRLRSRERCRRLLSSVARLSAEGQIDPAYRNESLGWRAAVPNQFERKSGLMHVISDVSTYHYQIIADFPTKRGEVCLVRFSIEVMRGGVSVTLLDATNRFALTSKNFDSPGMYQGDLNVCVGDNPSLTVLVANNVPNQGQSEFLLSQCDVYLSSGDDRY